MSDATPPGGLRARAARDVGIQVVGRIANLALGVVVTLVIVRALGVEGNGRWATLLAVQSIAVTLGELGLEPTAVRRAAAAPTEQRAWLGTLLVLRLALAVPASAVALAVGLALADTAAMRAAAVLVALVVLAGAPMSLRAAFSLAMRNDRTIAVVTFNSVIWTVAVVVIAALGGGLAEFALALLVTTAITSAVQSAWVARTAGLAFGHLRRNGPDMLRVGVVVGIGATLTLAYGRIDQVLVLHYNGERAAGLCYGAAYLLPERLGVIPGAVMATAYPVLAAAWPADPQRTRAIVTQVMEAMALVGLPVVAFTTVASRPLLELLYGAEFAAAADVLPVLMLAFASICFGYLIGYLAIVAGRQKTFVWIALGALVANVAANAYLLPRYGYVAAAWVTLATELLVIAWAARVVFAELGMSPRLGRLPNAVLAAAVMGAAVYAARALGAGAVVLGAVAAIVYPVAVIACGAISAADRDRLLRR